MYEIKRREHIAATVRVIGTDGEYVDFTTDISVDDIMREFTQVLKSVEVGQAVLADAKNAGDAEVMEKTYEALGGLVTSLMRMTFGDENGAKLLMLYNNAYIELLEDVLPFIRDVVAPKVSARLDEQAEKYKAER